MSSRDEVLRRVRSALQDVEGAPEAEAVEWNYGGTTPMDDVLARFVERVEDYRAVVEECGPEEVPARIAAALKQHEARSAVVPPGIDAEWRGAVPDPREDDGLSSRDLDGIDAVVTACAVGIAETGTIVLDHGPDQGRRALSLVPDVHICVVRADQVVSDVPEAVGRLSDAAAARRPMTWISGPSATSDIELSRVEGVHGPRTLHVIVVR